jgi:hypothetical protein
MVPYGSQTVHVAPISCTQLPHGPHTMHVAPIWCHPTPMHAHISHMAHSTPCEPMLAHSSHMAHATPWEPMLDSHMVPPVHYHIAPKLPPRGKCGSHMVSSTFHMLHRLPHGAGSSIWCVWLLTVNAPHGFTAPIQCTWLH